MASFTQRVLGTALLRPQVFEEVEHDTGATWQALAVVLLSSIATGIGVRQSFIGGLIAALVGWILWACLIYLIGTKLLPEPQTRSDVPELLRTTGFSTSPGLLRVLGFIPVLGTLVLLITSIWMLVAMIIAVRQALDYESTWRAILVSAIGWVVYLVVYGLLGLAFRPGVWM